MIGKNKIPGPIKFKNPGTKVAIMAAVGLFALFLRVVLPLGVTLLSAWIISYFFPLSFFEACLFSMGLGGIALLLSIRSKLSHLHEHIADDEWDSYDDDEDIEEEIEIDEGREERVRAILGKRDLHVTREHLQTYLEYLKQNMRFPCRLSGAEANWEAFYGAGLRNKLDELNKVRPSGKDRFKLIGFNEEIDEGLGILVRVQRVRDKKRCTLPLVAFAVVNEDSENHQLIEDYSDWFANNR
jgi:hypothetical protein